MDELLEMAILADLGDDDLEFWTLDNILVNRDNMHQRPKFNLNNLSDDQVKENFRFERGDLPLLMRALGIPDEIVTPTNNRVTGMTALCMVLKRLLNGHHNYLNNLAWLYQGRMRIYAQAINNKGAAINNCCRFIDGTKRAMCRPSVNQKEYYSGHKKFHCLVYQPVLCPDGMIASLKGAYPGKRLMLQCSGNQDYMKNCNKKQYSIISNLFFMGTI